MTDVQQATDAARRPPGAPIGRAVVTGASSGIGLELAKELRRHGYELVMAAEDEGIGAAAATLGGEAVRVDLTDPAHVERLWDRATANGRSVDLVVLNAGFGNGGRFVETSLDDDLDLIRLNVSSVVHLSKLALREMVARGQGRLLFTSSVAATMPGPYYATYAASKAFVQSFAEAVRREVADAGITVTALQPGPTDTRFFVRSRLQGTKVDRGPKDVPAEVARDGVAALLAGKDHVVAGSLRNTLQTLLARVLPQKVAARLHGAQTQR